MKLSILWTVNFIFILSLIHSHAYGVLAGGRPNAISGGQNAFAGVVNPANAVWIKDRFDIGLFMVYQNASLTNQNNNPLFPPGKTNLTYKTHYLCMADAAIHKRLKFHKYECSLSLATYTTPGFVKQHTKNAIPISGTTPIFLEDKTQVISSIFSLKMSETQSIGLSVDYFFLSHRRNGFQKADNPLRSVSPGHVTNKGKDYSGGLGLSLGWRWNITKFLEFGFAYIKRSYVGRYKKYRGYEPHHGKNFIPTTIGAGFTYHFTQKIAGRIEYLWTGYGSLPNSNNTITSDGKLNRNKRGSNKSPGTGLQDSNFINLGIGYKINSMFSIGTGLSHRIKRSRNSPYINSHSYMRQTIYNLLNFGLNFNYKRHDAYLTFSHGLTNREFGSLPKELGGGKFKSNKDYDSLSIAWGYLY